MKPEISDDIFNKIPILFMIFKILPMASRMMKLQ